MKIVTVVGIRGSGKTTVIEALIRELRSRELQVGTVKSIFCPAFHMDRQGSNTSRHLRAGAEIAAARAETETVLLYPYRLRPSEILEHYAGCGVVLFEGDYELPVPRIVAAHGADDARERLNRLTLAVSGRLANSAQTLDGLPVLHPERNIALLADLVLGTEEIIDFNALDRGLQGEELKLSRSFCETGCRGHNRKGESVAVTVDGKRVALTKEQESILRSWLR